ncbi:MULTISPECIES: colicin immunity domain-containing protein [unclassified Campylobacter]|uniref:colicin immunity domain-containing protein n=1 Tax=unclassified Campylobacter TaxID=2593542 RepID=UPI0022E9A5C6|nr:MULTISPECIES: colicin immunity domain-containing protein [unclassified Campylobacter]MDA3042458.1 colicin immunity domain-containing protein [Campylobacter sp. JMF_09 ED2]MDA3044728.1 colicin immunity domain-containing protein [Campylobacter sp. JMF_07 ED4]MDA3063150.1 colicin immunity domain-containing protein [Campylobacter sp. JMF_11 EL3]MDA3071705.1 colicin immunity domain-containing protein [Campylobacter sp. VBCF_03 NA9]MDA3074231.1 colicin immunity domain-containing protein [Campylob
MIYNNFLALMKDFVDSKINADTYQTYFFKLLHKDNEFFDKYYDIMQNLFYDVEEYCCDAKLRSVREIDEIGLKNNTANALKIITELSI